MSVSSRVSAVLLVSVQHGAVGAAGHVATGVSGAYMSSSCGVRRALHVRWVAVRVPNVAPVPYYEVSKSRLVASTATVPSAAMLMRQQPSGGNFGAS